MYKLEKNCKKCKIPIEKNLRLLYNIQKAYGKNQFAWLTLGYAL